MQTTPGGRADGPAGHRALIRVATDNDFNERIAQGCRRRLPGLEIISVRDTGRGSEEDPQILDWAARTGYVVVSHDVSTMTAAATDRLRNGLAMPGLVIVPQRLRIGEAVRRLVELLSANENLDLDGRIIFL